MRPKQNSFEAIGVMTREHPRSVDCLFAKGFTSIELIIVIAILSILTASIIVKNPFSMQDYSSIAAYQLIADIQYAQLRAMGTRSDQTITFYNNYAGYDVAGVRKYLPGNTQVISINFTNPLTFNSLGEPSSYGTISLSGGWAITVQQFTGIAQCPS